MADLETQITDAIQMVQAIVRWRPGSAARHLQKRKLRGHLPADATLHDYEHVIQAIVHNQDTQVQVRT